MTNAMIILSEQIRLQQEGILKYTGRVLTTMDGIEYPEIQPIHTYQTWKSLGYQVKKGSKAIAQFPIWKYVNSKKDIEKESAGENGGKMIMKKASWFSSDQVEKIESK